MEEAETLYAQEARPKPADGSEPDSTVRRPLSRPAALGDVIADKYRLMRTLGRGGMGRIFAADHLLLDTTVALKFMHPHLARDRVQVARFSREARAAATLKLYIVMEYLEGASLETMATDGRGLPVSDAVTYVVQACDALAEAHARSIIHRDVKPANLFLTKGKSGEPIIKVLDFGLAKSLVSSEGFSTTTATSAGQALGTPYYMSPEQITGAEVIDGRSDVWALGATLYELLTGTLAFPGGNAAMVFDRILHAQPAPLRSLRPDVPQPIVAIVDRCLQIDMRARFQTVRELVKALESALLIGGDPLPFVAAPLASDRFARSSAPPSLPPPPLEPSVRGTAVANPLGQAEPPLVQGPSMMQTLLAALAGPLLIALVAGGVVLEMRGDGDAAAPAHESFASKPIYLTAKSGDAARAKRTLEKPAIPEKSRR